MDVDSQATADMDEQDMSVDQVQQTVLQTAAPGVVESAPASRDEAADDDEATQSADEATESDEDVKAAAVMMPVTMPAPKPAPNRRSRASSPDPAEGLSLDDMRLTARQRARLEKEAGLAEDVQWHEMDMPPELAYTWKGKGNKTPNQMTEEEWLKRQEALERRRMRSLRDKREAEETVKAKIRKAVTVKFRGKLGLGAGEASGTEGEAGGRLEQESAIQPGWVKVRHTSSGSSIAWHPCAHPLSYPMSVVAHSTYQPDPIDLPLQPPAGAEQWQIPEPSSSSFKLGCTLALHHGSWGQQQQREQQQQQQQHSGSAGDDMQQQLWCVDERGWPVGWLPQQQVVDALMAAGYEHVLQQQRVLAMQGAGDAGAAGAGAALHPSSRGDAGGDGQEGMAAPAAAAGTWHGWRAVVKSLRRSQDQQQLKAVIVRLLPAGVTK